MIRILAAVVRSRRQKALAQCSHISLTVDDRADFRLLRYRCSFSSPHSFSQACTKAGPQIPALTATSTIQDWVEVEPLVMEGVLGVHRSGGNVPGNTIDSHDQDKSIKMAESVMDMMRQACQDAGGTFDQELFQHLCSHTCHFAADQGSSAHKCGQLLAQYPELCQLKWLSSDMAHQVRIASKDPLHANAGFNSQWERLFSARHALVPDIQHSEVWRSRLIAAQKSVLRSCGPQCSVDKVLRTFSFAKQRFDSTAMPMLKYCCMLRAIALVCAMQAGDAPCQV